MRNSYEDLGILAITCCFLFDVGILLHAIKWAKELSKGRCQLKAQNHLYHFQSTRLDFSSQPLHSHLFGTSPYHSRPQQHPSFFSSLQSTFPLPAPWPFPRTPPDISHPPTSAVLIWKFKQFLYNINHILMQKQKGKQQWTQEQKNLLAELFPKYSSKKWKMISIELAQKGFKRTELQCREKWINFLDPSLNNEEWSSTELQRLYNYHDKYGTRWCFMQKELNRTQNRIKNRFYGTIRNYIRLVLNTLCQRNTCFNTEINKISPSLLNDLYNSENIFDFLRGEIKKMIYRMKFKIDKKVLRNRIKDKENLYRELLGLIGSLFKGSFSLRFLEKIEKEDYDEEEQEIDQPESIKEIQKEVFIIERKSVKKEHVEIAKEVEEPLEKTLPSLIQQKSFKSESPPQNTNITGQQNNQNIKYPQYLYATNSPTTTVAVNQEQNNRNTQEERNFTQSAQFYPFYNHNPAAIQHELMMNSMYRHPYQLEPNFHYLIDKIRFQNLLMMQRQQQMLISQIIESNRHGR